MAVLLRWSIAGALGVAWACTASAATLDASLLPRVRAATFEVVAAKADESKVVYEKPLPLDQIPFQQRNDKYRSVGTAFAIGGGRFVTAMHVFIDGIDSLQGPLSLRDEQGHVFAIDKVLSFSPQEDFVAFSLVKAPDVQPLEMERDAPLNESVFAVGNALGTGVVIRDGLYTSDTPEEEQGRWKWMRFSAPASPGNSGGPLIDDKGKVIGVVLRKSPNENLNFALPIGRVLDASDKQAAIDLPQRFNPSFSSEMHSGRLQTTVNLPLTYAAFNTRIAQLTNEAVQAASQAWLRDNAATLFPAGPGSHELLLRGPWNGSLPTLATQGGSGNWVRPEPHPGRVPLPDKGWAEQVAMGGGMSWHLHSEADAPTTGKGGRAVMDTLLQEGNMSRDVGEDKVKLRSLGDARSSETFTDRQGRTWHLDAFAMPFIDSEILLATTATPDGASGMLRFCRARDAVKTGIQMRMTADLLDIAYRGTLAQWHAFLGNGPMPTAIKGASIHQDGKGVAIAMDDITARWPASVIPLNERTQLAVEPSWTMEDGKAALRVRRIVLDQPDAPEASIALNRYERAFDDSPQAAVSFWHELITHSHPRDGQPYDKEDHRIIADAYDPAHAESARYTYVLTVAVQGKASDADMHARLQSAEQGTAVPGATAPRSAAAAP